MNLKKMARLSVAAVVAVTAVAMLAPTAQAAKPKPPFERYAGCPNPFTEDPGVVGCLRSEVKSGHFQMGTKDVPIEKPIVLVGGVGGEFEDFVYNSEGGLLPAKQKVPGGVIGLTGLTWLLEFFGSEALTLYAVTELAGTPDTSNPEEVKLPVKVHLEHSVLGKKCYVGSTSNPISLNLITGTTSPPPPNVPISGAFGEFFNKEAEFSFGFKNIKYVDNEFAAPGASGCTLTLFGFIPISINGLVNTQSGLPSAAGRNETIQNTDLEIGIAQAVYHP